MRNLSGGGVSSEANLTQEELVFSFSTSSAPGILVYISSWTQDYLAVVLKHNGGVYQYHIQSVLQIASSRILNIIHISIPVFSGTLQIRYSLGGLREPYTIDVDHRNMANGQPHSVNITRNLREIRLQVSASQHWSITWKCYHTSLIRCQPLQYVLQSLCHLGIFFSWTTTQCRHIHYLRPRTLSSTWSKVYF